MIAQPVWCRRFVGRRDALAALSDARRALAHSRGTLVMLGGEAGIGKSRLVAQFLREVQGGRAGRVAVAESLPAGDEPLAPIRMILRALVDGADLGPLRPLARRAVEQLIPDVLTASAAPPGAGALGTAQLFAGAVDALRTLTAKRAAIAVAEDVHWADRTTLDFLAYLADAISAMRLLVIATYRSDELEANEELAAASERALRARGARHVVLEPFAGAELTELLDGVLETAPAPERGVVEAIARRCEGNPLFAEELLKDAIEHPGSGGAALPLSLRAGIRERLARLPPETRGVVESASVLGPRFDLAILARLEERPVREIVAALRRARDANILVEERGGASFRFRHALTRDAIYAGMLAAETRVLHAAVLRVYESLPDEHRPLGELAYHASEARDAAAALEYNERAGRAAAAIGAHPEAVRCFGRALAAARDEAERARVLEARANAQSVQGELGAAVRDFEEALAIRLRRGEHDDAVRLFIAAQGDRSNAGEMVADTLLAFIAQFGDRLGCSARDALYVFTARLMTGAENFEAARMLLESVSPPERLPPRLRANYHICLLNFHAYRGDRDAWRKTAALVHEVVAALPQGFGVTTLATIAQTGVWIGGGETVAQALAESEEIAETFGFTGIGSFVRAVGAHAAYLRGELAIARERIESVLRGPDIAAAHIFAAAVGPFVARALGEPELARRCLESRGARETLAESHASSERAVLVAGAAESAPPGDAASAANLIAELRALPRDAPLHPHLFRVAAERVALTDLAEVVAIAAPEHRLANDLAGRATSALVRSIAARRTRRVAESASLAAEAAASFATLGWPLFEARALEWGGDRERALEIYRRCGAAGHVRRLAGTEAAARSGAGPDVAPKDGTARSALSARELEVARLIADGATNDAIAASLCVSRKTVEKHVSSILAKLAFRSRAQIAAFVAAPPPR
jgi:DNA-binding CsgD family transcriptional regulator/tetratricopeptide (TPR) repeat protein